MTAAPHRSMFSHGGFTCLACGAELPKPLRLTASLRCHDCRELNAPLRVEHTHGERALVAPVRHSLN